MLCETLSVSSRIWTCVGVSISYDDNHYTTGTSFFCLNEQRNCDFILSWRKLVETKTKGRDSNEFISWKEKKSDMWSQKNPIYFIIDVATSFWTMKERSIVWQIIALSSMGGRVIFPSPDILVFTFWPIKKTLACVWLSFIHSVIVFVIYDWSFLVGITARHQDRWSWEVATTLKKPTLTWFTIIEGLLKKFKNWARIWLNEV